MSSVPNSLVPSNPGSLKFASNHGDGVFPYPLIIYDPIIANPTAVFGTVGLGIDPAIIPPGYVGTRFPYIYCTKIDTTTLTVNGAPYVPSGGGTVTSVTGGTSANGITTTVTNGTTTPAIDVTIPSILTGTAGGTFTIQSPVSQLLRLVAGTDIVLDPTSNLIYPGSDNVMTLGKVTSKFLNVNSTTFTGELVGNASTASTAPAGTLTGTTLASNVVSSSLTSLGTIGTLTATTANITTLNTNTISGVAGADMTITPFTGKNLLPSQIPCVNLYIGSSTIAALTNSNVVLSWTNATTNNAGMWTSGDPTRITIQKTGVYLIVAQVDFSVATGRVQIAIEVSIGGSYTGVRLFQQWPALVLTTNLTVCCFVAAVPFVAGEFFRVVPFATTATVQSFDNGGHNLFSTNLGVSLITV